MSTVKFETGTYLAPGLLVALRRVYDGSPFQICNRQQEKGNVSRAKFETGTYLAPGLLVALRHSCDGSRFQICKKEQEKRV